MTESARISEHRALTSRAGLVAAGTLVSRILGLGRELVLAAMYERAATDAFMVAFLIPNVLRQLLAEGAVQTAVLPVLTRTREQEGEEAARGYFAAVRGISLCILSVVTVLGVIFAEPLVRLFADGFEAIPGQIARTTTLTRWLFPYIFFMGTAALGSAALNAAKRFTVTSFAPALLNVSFIVLALALPGWFIAHGKDPILALGAGALVGGALQVVAQWPSLLRIGYLGRPVLQLAHKGVRESFKRMAPAIFGLGIYLVDVTLSRRFLSELGLGPQTYFGFALRLCDFPQGIFVMAIQTAALPSLTLLHARNDREGLESTYAFGVRLTLFIAIAATALFVGLAGPIVTLLFQRGHFDALASAETARALMAQGAGIWMVAIVRQLVAVYFACGDTRTPVLVSFVDFLAFVGLAIALKGPFGHVGIGMAVTGSSAVQMALLWWRLGAHLGSRRWGEIGRSAAKTLTASVFAAAAGAGAARALSDGNRMLPGVVGVTVFVAVFVVTARLVRSEELETILGVVRGRRA